MRSTGQAASAAALETERILDELRRAVEGDAWHGPALHEVLDGVTAQQAAARPIPSAHTIGELVLHLAGWAREAARRLRDGDSRMPEGGDWPKFAGGEEGWAAALRRLEDAHQELLAAVAAFPSERLDELVGRERNAPLGTGRSFAVLLHGVAQHHAYHGGQITLLRRAQVS